MRYITDEDVEAAALALPESLADEVPNSRGEFVLLTEYERELIARSVIDAAIGNKPLIDFPTDDDVDVAAYALADFHLDFENQGSYAHYLEPARLALQAVAESRRIPKEEK